MNDRILIEIGRKRENNDDRTLEIKYKALVELEKEKTNRDVAKVFDIPPQHFIDIEEKQGTYLSNQKSKFCSIKTTQRKHLQTTQ